MSVVVVDSGGANISSVLHALKRLGVEPRFTADPGVISAADRVILPGVGAAGRAMEMLRSHGLPDVIRALKQPVLGICLGMQLLFDSSEEGDTDMLGIIPARLARLAETPHCRVPHMGWNVLQATKTGGLAAPLNNRWVYFVHSYAAPLGAWTLASSCHGQPFSALFTP